jgi:glycosyltransferase involved in cell wall biosynthesis
MKILLANNKLRYLGGTETYTYTLAGQLIKNGHQVEAFTFRPGLISDRLKQDFCVNLSSGKQKYDVILANHTTCVKHLRELNPGFIIQTCHGVTTALEQPSPFAHAHVAISEELSLHVHEITGKPAPVILNGIDCTRFRPVTPVNKRIKKVLSLAHNEALNSMLEKEFSKYGIRLYTLNKLKAPVWNVEDYINRADLVVSLGRGAYEAMACGRPVLVVDHRPGRELKGDGIILPRNIDEFIHYNCRGQARRESNVSRLVEQAIAYYSPEAGRWCREYALENLNIESQTEKYISLCKELTWYMF